MMSAVFAAALMLMASACGASEPAPTQEATQTIFVEPPATPTAAPPTPTVATPTPTAAAPTSATPSMAGIDVDPAKAEATLLQLVDALDEPEYYCVDVPGFGGSLNLQSTLMAHTCKPGADLRCNCTLYHFVLTTPLIERDAVQQSVIPALSRNPVPGGCIQTGWLWQTGHSFSPLYGGITANWY